MAKRTIWITGGGTGIGRELAHSFASDGDSVVISGRTAETLKETAAGYPAAISCVPLDVTDPAAVSAAVDSIEYNNGPIQIAVLNAGQFQRMWATAFDRTIFQAHIQTNLMGVVNALEPLLKRMIGRGKGVIVIVGSVAGYRGLPGAAAYGASKAALINMAESLYPDALQLGVRIVLVNPGFVRTPLTAGNDFTMPFLIDVAEAVHRIRTGIDGDGFEIAFPRRFALLLKLARLLPYRGYFALTRRMLPKR